MTGPPKMRAKNAAKRALNSKNGHQAKHGLKSSTFGDRALKIGRVAFSIAKFAVTAGLLVASAFGAAALMPKQLRKQVVGDVKHIAALTTSEVTARAHALGV